MLHDGGQNQHWRTNRRIRYTALAMLRVPNASMRIMCPLQRASTGSFEWTVKIARIWVHKCAVLGTEDLFRRDKMVAIFIKILKQIKIRQPTKKNEPFLKHYGGMVPTKNALFLFTRKSPNFQIGFGTHAHLHHVACTNSSTHSPQAMATFPHVLRTRPGPPLADRDTPF